MKPPSQFSLLAIVAILFAAVQAQAYFDPHIGRWASRDPIGDLAFRQQIIQGKTKAERKLFEQQALGLGYVFVDNDGINHYDYLGLSGRDVLKMWAIFANTLQEYCKKCIRCDIPWLGNATASIPWTSARGCT